MNKLADRCRSMRDAANKGKAWLSNDKHTVITGPGASELALSLGKIARRAARLEEASTRKPALSVFGPSQAGKSFLVSVLAKPQDAALQAKFGAETLDYIREINPEGEGESTGLVTRFTTEPIQGPEAKPVALDLMSEADVIRCLVNSFFLDGDQSDEVPNTSEIREHLKSAQSASHHGPAAGLTEDDVREVQSYVEREFVRTAYGKALEAYWDTAATVLPRLDRKSRSEALSILWGKHEVMTDCYLNLTSTLDMLDHVSRTFVGTEALVPRESSIIDVKTLHLMSSVDGGGPIETELPSGEVIELQRATLCALAAELIIPMVESPAPIFDRMDLLDFPGARNRFEQPLSSVFADGKDAISELLLRGKVAYLFDRYCGAQDISGMLLCVPDSNMETVDLPRLVDRWIELTHGKDRSKRQQDDCGLFVTLTKFDKHLVDSATEAGDKSRFDRRLHASLLEKFGKGQDPWVSAWSHDAGFNNCFWLRNPNFFAEAIYAYDDDRRETIRPEKLDRIEELRQGFLSSEIAQKHFRNCERAWDAAIAANDGGVSYLLEAIDHGCDPDLKKRHIEQQIKALGAEIDAILRPFHVSEVAEERVEKAQKAANSVTDALEKALADGKFGALIRSLMVSQDEIAQRISRTPEGVRVALANESGGRSENKPKLRRPGAKPQSNTASTTVADVMSPREFQARTAIELWARQVERIGARGDSQTMFSLPRQEAGALASTLIKAAERTKMEARLTQALEAVGYGLTLEEQAKPAAVICSAEINRFVETVGQGSLPEESRVKAPDAEGCERPVFAENASKDEVGFVPEASPQNFAVEFWSDWAFALYDAFEQNALGASGEPEMKAANTSLGDVLNEVRAVA